jgi:hypothetical protein
VWFFIIVVLLWLAGEQWPAFKLALRIAAGLAAVIGLAILTKVGFVVPFIDAVISIPIDFFSGLFGIIKALLFG